MGRILFFLILGFVFWLAVRLLLTTRKPDSTNIADEARDNKNGQRAPPQIAMAQCAYCGVHLPEAEIIRADDGRVFCTQTHHDAAHRG